eukprot:jgi/Chrzof1/8129/UNPLg00174.t1
MFTTVRAPPATSSPFAVGAANTRPSKPVQACPHGAAALNRCGSADLRQTNLSRSGSHGLSRKNSAATGRCKKTQLNAVPESVTDLLDIANVSVLRLSVILIELLVQA